MSFTYKNLLIVTRGSNNIDTVNLTKDQYHIWFNQHPLKYQSNQDKIVIFYELPQPNGSDGLVELGETTRFTPTGTPQGIIKLLCDGLSIKITECIFNSADDFEKYLLTFRDYLIATIKAAGITDLVTNKVTLFWKKKTLNSVVRSISKECGLLTNESNKSHTFVATEINCSKDSKQILQTTRLNTSSYQQQQPGSTFGSQQEQPGSTFGSQQQQPGSTFGSQQQQPGTTFGSQHPGSTFGSRQQQPGSAFGSQQQPGTTFGSQQPGSAFGSQQQPRTTFSSQQPGSAFGSQQQQHGSAFGSIFSSKQPGSSFDFTFRGNKKSY
jgi:hypothetical protein